MRRQIALVGIGKIARDQHVPALAASPAWDLAATCSREGSVAGIPAYTDFDRLLAERPEIEVISLCLPPVPRFAYAEKALRAGRHVMLEKPPGQTLAEVMALEAMARDRGVTLYATWHSRMAHAVDAARDRLAGATVTRAHITWKEDVRRWHPGQDWVFDPGGMGVFDPAINALSILTAILPFAVHLTAADLDVPANRAMPIAARLTFTGNVTAEFDWRQQGPQTWDIGIDTDAGRLTLKNGGARLLAGDEVVSEGPDREYPRLYDRLSHLVASGECDVDLAPFVHVADALMIGRRASAEPFDF
jgi:D-galactose 1-dehydrogenase